MLPIAATAAAAARSLVRGVVSDLMPRVCSALVSRPSASATLLLAANYAFSAAFLGTTARPLRPA
jgi:hypothetical protein